MMLDLKQLAYAMLITSGAPTNGRWSYYGNTWEVPDSWKPIEYAFKKRQKKHKQITDKIKTIGLDWKKMEMPRVETHDSFNGTFAEDSLYTEVSIGELVFKDGERILFGSNQKIEFSEELKLIYEFMTDKSKIEDIFGKEESNT